MFDKPIYFAPLEGITGYLFRNAFHAVYGGIDRYYIPFISPAEKRGIRTREKKDVIAEHNQGFAPFFHSRGAAGNSTSPAGKNVPLLIPQILTNNVDGFFQVADMLGDLGYGEVNLNLGCPAGTVVRHHKGSGMLEDPRRLDQFLGQLFEQAEKRTYHISIKTRLGMLDPEEFEELLTIYEKYPISELTIHPRVQKEMYKGSVHLEEFAKAVQKSQLPICYNGDIVCVKDAKRIREKFPQITAIMCGRGLLRQPQLAELIQMEEEGIQNTDYVRLRKFHDKYLEACKENLYGEATVLHKMKELWVYLQDAFLYDPIQYMPLPGRSQNPEQHAHEKLKAAKKIKKAGELSTYISGVEEMFRM